MAANLQSPGLTSFGKRFVTQIRSRYSIITRRGVHVSVSAYDKNPEEHAHSTVVPDEVIPPQPDQYWVPHPRTGVFGPTTDQNPSTDKEGSLLHVGESAESVLEQKAFFRPLEDLDKPPPPYP